MKLTFVVDNTTELFGGTPAACQFDSEGGVIGSAEGNKWQLLDRKGGLDGEHLAIFQADGKFCGEVVGNSGIVINGSQRPATKGTIFRICDGDTYKVGTFNISAILELDKSRDREPENGKPADPFISLETLVPDRKKTKKQNPDRVVMLGDATGPAEDFSDIDKYISNMEIDLGDQNHDSSPRSNTELAEVESWTGGIKPEEQRLDDCETIDHVVLRPLLAALGISIREMSVPEANRLTREIGEAVFSTIKGIMEVHRSQQTDRSYMKESQLHLLEDNPFRLETNPEDAIKDLFFSNSPVHLNASSAISESFELMANHEKANAIATEKALESVLQALAPHSLARRFSKYRGHAPRTGNLDAWHWQMYQHYYNELKTDRQRGLGRMFKEVYEQVYSQTMRQQTLENDQ